MPALLIGLVAGVVLLVSSLPGPPNWGCFLRDNPGVREVTILRGLIGLSVAGMLEGAGQNVGGHREKADSNRRLQQAAYLSSG